MNASTVDVHSTSSSAVPSRAACQSRAPNRRIRPRRIRLGRIRLGRFTRLLPALVLGALAITGGAWAGGPRATLRGQQAGESPTAAAARSNAHPESWKAGVAATVITPTESMWMAGYAARTEPSDGKVHDLHAKALALEGPQGNRLVIVTTDLIGIPRALREDLERLVEEKYQLPPRSLLLNASHTHCGPELRTGKASLYGIAPERIAQSREYVNQLRAKLVTLVGQALDDLRPAQVGYTHARAGFAMNRRLPTDQGFLNRPNPDGPVDHDVPVLRVDSPEGTLRAVLFGYACHNTTLGFQKFCGDYAGFAQEYLEQEHPDTVALFLTGCGGDQNPQPRRTLELAQQHGRTLATAVEAALTAKPRPIEGELRTALDKVRLDFAETPSPEYLRKLAESGNKYDRRRAAALLEQLETEGRLPESYDYLVQVARFGDQLTMVALAGEVVVDYSLRLKLELDGPAVWVAGYSNDVFAYIPSVRVLREGGYEGGGAMRYTTLPGPWAPSIEQRIVDKVRSLADQVTKPPAAATPRDEGPVRK